MNLVINNKLINEPIYNILVKLKSEANKPIFDKIEDKGSYIRCTCPFHKDGRESHPSFSVYASYNGDVIPGTYHCFTCDTKGQLYQLVAYCLDCDEMEAKDWLVTNFSNIYEVRTIDLPEIELTTPTKEYLNESILDRYSFLHPYMFERKLKENIIKKFRVGYNKETDSITFPIWNENNKLVGITERCVATKKFNIPKHTEKPVYLFNAVKNKGYPYVIVCEAQIDALTAWGYGVPAVAMLGVGSKDQYAILNKVCMNWVTMFDGDDAGKEATKRFNKLIRKDCLVTNVSIPAGHKDINDLSEDEFNELLNSYGLIWRLDE